MKPKFQPGETLRTARYVPPLPKGATVTVVRVKEDEEKEFAYLVEGRRTTASKMVEVWVTERDLKVAILL